MRKSILWLVQSFRGVVQLENASEWEKEQRKRGFIYLYTGQGEGKTTNAIGLALRTAGHGYRAVVIQFMKGRGEEIGEFNIQKRLQPEYIVYQFGRKEFIDFNNPRPLDYELAKKGLDFAKKVLKERPKLLILDEINLAVHFKILPLSEVVELLKNIPRETTVVLTGRRAPEELIDMADLVTEMRLVKHPFEKGVQARKGVEY